MSITKTGINLSRQGASTITFEEDGQQSVITANGLVENTTYTVTAYVVEDNGRTTQSASSSQFSTLSAGDITLTNQSTYNGTVCTVYYLFTSTYPIDVVKIFNDKTKDFLTPTTYTPTVSGRTSGSFRYRINEPYEWIKISVSDMYGEVNEEEIFNIKDLPTP